ILAQLPIDQLVGQLNASPEEVERAAAAALPALLGGLQANAADPAGAASIASALDQHSPDLVEGGVDLSQVDTADGARIASHIFGGNEDQVVHQLGGLGGDGLVKKLIPILAPIVLSYLAKQVGGGSSKGGGLISSVLEEILKGASQGSGTRGTSAGSIIGDLLGGLLGGGRR
ncbi:MAG: DUF937 domain-containing protein, partial [Myxococcales bacterium]